LMRQARRSLLLPEITKSLQNRSCQLPGQYDRDCSPRDSLSPFSKILSSTLVPNTGLSLGIGHEQK
jgi:hypothetical protein